MSKNFAPGAPSGLSATQARNMAVDFIRSQQSSGNRTQGYTPIRFEQRHAQSFLRSVQNGACDQFTQALKRQVISGLLQTARNGSSGEKELAVETLQAFADRGLFGVRLADSGQQSKNSSGSMRVVDPWRR